MTKTIYFRPHHFLCALCFQGKGYSPSFIANFSAIMLWLAANSETECIEVVQTLDSICSPCPHNEVQQCATQSKISQLDTAHSNALHWVNGEHYSWESAKAQLRQYLTLPTFQQICRGCSWQKSGLCESAIQQFLQT